MSISSSLVQASQSIVRANRSAPAMRKTKNEYSSFLRFMDVQTSTLKSQKINQRKLKKALSANVTTSFGNTGNLLSGLASGALDAASFIGGFFDQNRKVKPNTKAGKPIPKGPKVRFGGMRALGIANAAFAGLDFATGLAEGESVGKAAAGAGGSLAGSLLGGAIGQALIPIPGVGFMVGSALGGMAGGYLGDRAYEGVTGEGSAEQKTSEKVREQAEKQRASLETSTETYFYETLDKFEGILFKFNRVAQLGAFGAYSSVSSETEQDTSNDVSHAETPDRPSSKSPGKTVDNTYTAEGGEKPSKYVNTLDYNEFRQYYNEGKGGRHKGEDLPIKQGTPISIIVPGTVFKSGFAGGGAGGEIIITHEDGTQTRYLHMSEILVSPGQRIESGQVIGKTGGAPGTQGAGHSTGPHLHLEYYPTTTSAMADPNPVMDKYFRFGGNIKVKKKSGEVKNKNSKGSPPPPPKKLTEDEFHSVRTTSDIEDKWDDRVGGSQTYDEYLKYYEKNKDVITKALVELTSTIEPVTSEPEVVPEPTSSRTPDIRSQAAERRREQLESSTQQIIQALVQVPEQIQQPLKNIGSIQQYPSYNIINQGGSVIVVNSKTNAPAQIMSDGGGQESPQPSFGGPSQSSLLNSLVKTMLLTNLSST